MLEKKYLAALFFLHFDFFIRFLLERLAIFCVGNTICITLPRENVFLSVVISICITMTKMKYKDICENFYPIIFRGATKFTSNQLQNELLLCFEMSLVLHSTLIIQLFLNSINLKTVIGYMSQSAHVLYYEITTIYQNLYHVAHHFCHNVWSK